MPYAVRILSRPDVGAGFALTGLRTVEASTPNEGRERLEEILAQPEVGVVLIDESLYQALPDSLRRRLGRRSVPLVVPFPVPTWTAGVETPEAYIVELLRQVIGYRVRIK